MLRRGDFETAEGFDCGEAIHLTGVEHSTITGNTVTGNAGGILLTDDKGVRADMTASWLAQMGWEVYVLEGGYAGTLEVGPPLVLPKPDPAHRYRRP